MSKDLLTVWPHMPSARATIPSGEDPANPSGWKDNLDRIAELLNKKMQEPDSPEDGALIRWDSVAGVWVPIQPGTDGQVLKVVSGVPSWVNGGSTVRVGHTWAIPGVITASDIVVPFFVSVGPLQSAKIAKARFKINSGTSLTCSLRKNGVDVTGYTGLTVTTTATNSDAPDVDLADDDMLQLVITAVSGNPSDLTFTVFIEYGG